MDLSFAVPIWQKQVFARSFIWVVPFNARTVNKIEQLSCNVNCLIFRDYGKTSLNDKFCHKHNAKRLIVLLLLGLSRWEIGWVYGNVIRQIPETKIAPGFYMGTINFRNLSPVRKHFLSSYQYSSWSMMRQIFHTNNWQWVKTPFGSSRDGFLENLRLMKPTKNNI